MKKTSCSNLSPPGVVKFPAVPLAEGSPSDICHNLRPCIDGSGLEPVGSPRRVNVDAYPGARLLPGGCVRGDDGSVTLFFVHDGRLLCQTDGSVTCLDPPCGGVPGCMFPVADGLLVMMGEGASPMRVFRAADGWAWVPAIEIPEPLCIVRKDEGVISAKIDSCRLKGSYDSRSTLLSADDELTLRKAMVEAYLHIGDRAMAERVFFQPVMARYRLRGHDGNVIYSSAPVIVAPSSGVQATVSSFTLSGSDFSSLSASEMSAGTFSLRLRSTGSIGESWLKNIGSVELLVSPQLHPLEENLCVVHRFGHFTATTGSLTVCLPGVDSGSNSGFMADGRLRSLVASMLGRLDSALETVGTFRCSVADGPWESVGTPFYSNRRGCSDDVKSLRRVFAVGVSGMDAEQKAMSGLHEPHCLNAEAVGVSGDTIAMCGLSASRFKGYLPVEMSLDFKEDAGSLSLPSACRVVFSDGSSVVRSHTMRGVSMALFSPLLAYPSGDAVEMHLYYGCYSLHVALHPDPSGQWSYWLSPGIMPVEMNHDMPAFVLPSENPEPMRFPGLVGVAVAGTPLNPVALTRCTGAGASAVVAASSDSGSWDVGSARFYLLGKGGIDCLTVNSARTRATLRKLDGRAVDSAESVCVVDGGVAALVGTDIIMLKGQRIRTLCSNVAGLSKLGWCGKRGELWAFPGDESDKLRVIIPSTGRYFTRENPLPLSLLSAASGLWMTDMKGDVYDLSDEIESSTAIAYRVSVPAVPACPSRVLFGLPLRGMVENGTLEIRGDNGFGFDRSDMLVSYSLSGDFAHLPLADVLAPHRHRFILVMDMTVGSGRFVIKQPSYY